MTREEKAERCVRQMIAHVDNEMTYLHAVDVTMVKDALYDVGDAIPCVNVMLLERLISLPYRILFTIELGYANRGKLSIWPMLDELAELYPEWEDK